MINPIFSEFKFKLNTVVNNRPGGVNYPITKAYEDKFSRRKK